MRTSHNSLIAGMIVATLGLAGTPALASVTNGLGIGSFAGATVEKFNHGSWVQANSYDFGNGLSYQNNSPSASTTRPQQAIW